MKIKKITIQEATKVMLNKMLEKYNITIAEITEKTKNHNGQINGVDWYTYYTMTQKEHDIWKLWCLDFLKTKVKPKTTIKYSKFVFNQINLMWGLKIK